MCRYAASRPSWFVIVNEAVHTLPCKLECGHSPPAILAKPKQKGWCHGYALPFRGGVVVKKFALCSPSEHRFNALDKSWTCKGSYGD